VHEPKLVVFRTLMDTPDTIIVLCLLCTLGNLLFSFENIVLMNN